MIAQIVAEQFGGAMDRVVVTAGDFRQNINGVRRLQQQAGRNGWLVRARRGD